MYQNSLLTTEIDDILDLFKRTTVSRTKPECGDSGTM